MNTFNNDFQERVLGVVLNIQVQLEAIKLEIHCVFKEMVLLKKSHDQPSKILQLPNQQEQEQAIKTAVLLRKAIWLMSMQMWPGRRYSKNTFFKGKARGHGRQSSENSFQQAEMSSKQESHSSGRIRSLGNSCPASNNSSDQ